MRTVSRSLLLSAVAGVFGLALLTSPNGVRIAAQEQEQEQRPAVSATIVLREGDKLTLNRGSQNGLRKGDKLRIFHNVNGKDFKSGKAVVTRVYGTTAEAKVTEQTGVVGLEDTVALEIPMPSPKPSKPTRKTPVEPTPNRPVRETPVEPSPGRSTRNEPVKPQPGGSTRNTRVASHQKKPTEPIQPTPNAPIRRTVVLLPLLPQFSAGKTEGAAFTLDYTNDTAKVIDGSIYLASVHIMLDGQDYRVRPTTTTGAYDIDPGKTRVFSFNLTDFMVTQDKDVWPLKTGRHTILFRFGGKQYGPLMFDWHEDKAAH